MRENIGIIGLGTVGKACKFGFEKLGHSVFCHDTTMQTSIEDVIDTKIVFICVPTPSRSDGSCNVEIVESVIRELKDKSYKGIIAIKSTVAPGTTQKLRDQTGLNICFVPEFLRERCAVADFVENHVLLAVGCDDDQTYDFIKKIHGNYPKAFKRLGIIEAELLKYYSNIFNAVRIIFANEFYEVCDAVGASYEDVKDAYILTGAVPDRYLDVNDNFRGYGGVCLPKDVKAIVSLQKQLGLNLSFFENLDKENSKYKTTVPNGMRLK